ncbi:hypothetical protein JZO77_03970 [Enterococcus hulanensis]|uniref:hypothetical protein n=1 Tax=Enterococcus hulanensis TaxID=2559929 RepID=UPI001A8D3200|nr:hypothetical protein [Enterococcus hulanensis]MBO0455893.1 hypothetical protein [Enterococcus hulanensis]
MFKNSIMFFSDGVKVDDIRKLINDYDKAIKEKDKNKIYGLQGKIIQIMKKRINSRYLKVVKECIKLNDDNFGFMIMSINCILIELYYQLENGVDETSDFNGQTRIEDAFRHVLPKLHEDFSTETGTQFYEDIRCKLIHQAQTNTNVAISFGTPDMIYPYDQEEYTVYNPELFFNQIMALYNTLFNRALHENNVTLKNNITEKVRHIAYKNLKNKSLNSFVEGKV